MVPAVPQLLALAARWDALVCFTDLKTRVVDLDILQKECPDEPVVQMVRAFRGLHTNALQADFHTGTMRIFSADDPKAVGTSLHVSLIEGGRAWAEWGNVIALDAWECGIVTT